MAHYEIFKTVLQRPLEEGELPEFKDISKTILLGTYNSEEEAIEVSNGLVISPLEIISVLIVHEDEHWCIKISDRRLK